ncbi:lysophospholipid acyltransferase family protein [Roseibacillus ishigakijimensis]|uniref:1-acyl-sn-glycerol-3-phosphate acyltransferase n=1 Tax=Roseibacillus ishigakijimensis TaxID=454146 RepID=A0A934RWM2_9BACT|nr:lysophospholipid acyltransferase family protein [Roseibacillus ishigakijimensis]MBK1835500.1 1-acyl-sn-glycerol-3-phosphate acyltransferase [Roseibacillus ishigakijimensis]
MITPLLPALVRLLTGVRLTTSASEVPDHPPRVYFGNHSSHLDFLLIWAALPAALREKTRPVAARDYWEANALRRRLAQQTFRALLVDRGCFCRQSNPLQEMVDTLNDGHSLIVFPEGTRESNGELQDFKSGLYHLAKHRPKTEFVPVWLENAFRILPKGEILPLPLLASLHFGSPLSLQPTDNKPSFLTRCRESLLALREQTPPSPRS